MRRLKSPQERLRAAWTQITPTPDVALTVRMRRIISHFFQRAAMDNCSLLLGLISVAQPFCNYAVIVIIIMIVIIIIIITIPIIKLVTFPIYLSFCIQTPSLLHEFLWGARQGKRKLSRISASKDKALSQKRALFATLRDLTDVRALEWTPEVQESTPTKLPSTLASLHAQ